MADVSELLAAHDAFCTCPEPLPRGVTVERDGSLVRFFGLAGRGFVVYRDLGGLEGAGLDELIARQVKVFAERDERFEWKLHGHDQPGDLSKRLRAAGFVPEETETVVIATVPNIAAEVNLPEGVSLREVTSRADLQRIAALEQAVWGDKDQQNWLVDMLESERAVDPMHSRSWSQRSVRPSSAPRGSDSSATPISRHSGAARPCRSGGGAGSTVPPSPTGRPWLQGVASATSRLTPPTTAARSSSVSASPP